MNKKTTYKIAIIGPKDLVYGFEALGVRVFDINDPSKVIDTIKEIRKKSSEADQENFAVIFILESLLQGVPEDEYRKVTQGALPAFLSLPDLQSSDDVGTAKLRKLAEKAIGSDILK